MAKDTYQSIQAQIKRLQDKADVLRNKQRQPIIAAIVRQLDEYSISLDEIKAAQTKGTPRRTNARAAKPAAAAKPTRQVAPKYRHPETNETWTGRGKAPRWLAAAEAQGQSREEFLIK